MAEYTSNALPADRNTDAIFQNDIDKKYICPICISFLKDPVQTSCGHRFCKKCFDDLRGFQPCHIPRGIIKCPVDNTFIIYKKEVFDDNAMKREIQSLGVVCNNVDGGCLWRGELGYLKDHLQTCTHFMDDCPYDCGTKLLRSGMNKHKEECDHREVECEHCHLKLKLFSLIKHQVLTCQMLPVSCTTCGQTGILRKDITQHIDPLRGDCQLTKVPCKYASSGCNFQSERCNIAKHYEDADTHIDLLERRVHQQDSRIADLEQKLQRVMTHFNFL